MEALQGLLSGAQDVVTLEKRYRHKDGHPFWMLIRSSVVPGPDDRPAYLVSHYEAIGDGQMRNTHLAHMALHDPLTGLANRALLTDPVSGSDRKSTRLNSSHVKISYAVFCLKKKTRTGAPASKSPDPEPRSAGA